MMSTQEEVDYARIEKAIVYIREHFKEQPDLEELARAVGLSSYHFQRMFREWAGLSPKKFLQYTTLEYSKQLLKDSEKSLFDTAYEAGLSGTGRLHDLFVKLEGMTPGEYKNGGTNLVIHYYYYTGVFGELLIASTSKGVCAVRFCADRLSTLNAVKQDFPRANYILKKDHRHQSICDVFSGKISEKEKLILHVKGTAFQLKVWEALLRIPKGQQTSYGMLAKHINVSGASRAVGTAIGKNPIAYLIPCHRVIRANGESGGYRWGTDRKTAMLGWEGALGNEHRNKK